MNVFERSDNHPLQKMQEQDLACVCVCGGGGGRGFYPKGKGRGRPEEIGQALNPWAMVPLVIHVFQRHWGTRGPPAWMPHLLRWSRFWIFSQTLSYLLWSGYNHKSPKMAMCTISLGWLHRINILHTIYPEAPKRLVENSPNANWPPFWETVN